MRDSLHLFIRMVLGDLPDEARILCVGAGTGPELIYLAKAFPLWHFTIVEPAAPMLAVCRQRAEDCGITSRCTFHEGFLASLAPSEKFHAATSILVSQFIMVPEKRSEFFGEIAARLHPEGYLINADLASDMSSSDFKSLVEVWAHTLKYADVPAEEVQGLGKRVAVLPSGEIKSLITAGGFTPPIQFFQAILIHAWYAKLKA